MIKIYKSKPIRDKDLKTLDEVKIFVRPTELWYGYEIKLDDVKERLRFGEAEIQVDDIKLQTNIIYYDDIILGSTHCSINELITACKGTKYSIPPVEITRMGYIDEVHRRKYISTPINGYWDYSLAPIIMIKI